MTLTNLMHLLQTLVSDLQAINDFLLNLNKLQILDLKQEQSRASG